MLQYLFPLPVCHLAFLCKKYGHICPICMREGRGVVRETATRREHIPNCERPPDEEATAYKILLDIMWIKTTLLTVFITILFFQCYVYVILTERADPVPPQFAAWAKTPDERVPSKDIEEFNPHVLYESFGNLFGQCNSDMGSDMQSIVTVLPEGQPHISNAVFSSRSGPFRAMLCLSNHDHYHTIRLRFENAQPKGSKQHCTALMSTSAMLPDITHWDWRLTDRPIAIHSYSPEFKLSDSFYISIRNSTVGQNCSVELIVEETPIGDVLKKSDLLGRDALSLIGSSAKHLRGRIS